MQNAELTIPPSLCDTSLCTRESIKKERGEDLGRYCKMVREFISGPTEENGHNYGRWYLLPEETKRILKWLCDECEVFERAADSYAMENISLKRECEQNKKGHSIYIDFATSPMGTGTEMLKRYKVKVGKKGDGEKEYLLKINLALRDENKMLREQIRRLQQHNMYLYDTYAKGSW